MTNQEIPTDQAYVLHRIPYRETSLIVEFFTRENGRISCVAKSARGPRSRFRGQVSPFCLYDITWRGDRELKTLCSLTPIGVPPYLAGDVLWSGFYINELLQRLIPKGDGSELLFEQYERLMKTLPSQELDCALRYFECDLLAAAGYALPLQGVETHADYYRYQPDLGFTPCAHAPEEAMVFSAKALRALQQRQLIEPAHRQEIKRLMRMVVAQHLGNQPLKTRQHMQALQACRATITS